MQRIAELVGAGLLGAHVAEAAVVGLVAAGAVAQQALIDVAQRQLADLAHALGRQLHAAAAGADVAGLLEDQQELAQGLEVLRRLVAQHLAQVVEAERLEVAGEQLAPRAA